MKRILTSLLLLLLLSWLAVTWFIKLEHQPDYKGMSPAEQAAAETMKPEYTPLENPKPKYFMTISGKVDPGLLKGLDLQKVTVTYHTHNETCMYDASGGFEGAMFPRDSNLDYKIKPNKKSGKFSVVIPLDKLQPGYCKWRISVIDYKFRYRANNPVDESPDIIIAYFNSKAEGLHHTGVDEWSCGSKFCKQVVSKSIGNSHEDHLSPYNNYAFQINFIKKEPDNGNYT